MFAKMSEKTIRLRGTEELFLQQYRFNDGEIRYNKDQKTLVLFDGFEKGGIPLLRADLSNISGGGSAGAGVVNFGAKSLQAQSFIGDGSQLTNLPIPPDLATISYVNSVIPGPATASVLGTIKVGSGLEITADGTLSAQGIGDITELSNLDIISFKAGVAVTEFSSDPTLGGNSDSVVPTEAAVKTYVDGRIEASFGSIDLDANGIVNSGLSGSLAYYSNTGNTINDVGSLLTWSTINNTLTTSGLSVTQDASVSGTLGVSGKTTIDDDLDVTGSLEVTNTVTVGTSVKTPKIYDDTLGIITFTSGSDFIIDAAGDINMSGSKIINVGAPILASDVATKAYVDSSSSAFGGGDVSGDIRILDTSIGLQLVVSGTTSTTNIITTITSTNGLVVGDPVVFTGTTFGGVIANVTYYVRTIPSGTQFTISDTAGGPAKGLTTATGTMLANTGGLVVSGGASLGGNLYAAGTIFMGGSAVLTSLSGGYNGGTISGTVFINNSTASTSTTTGALRVTGGVGIAGRLNAGGDIIANGIRLGNGADPGAGFAQNVAVGGGSGINGPLGSNVSGVNNIAIGFSTLGQQTGNNNNIAIGNQSQSARTAGNANIAIGTDTLRDNQGSNNLAIGHLGGHLLLTGSNNVIIGGNDGATINATSGNVIIADGAGTVKVQFNGSGALGLAGANYGTAGQILASAGPGNPLTWIDGLAFEGGVVPEASTFESALEVQGILSVTNATVSTSSTTGALVVTGGVGIGGDTNIAGSIVALSINNTPIGNTTKASAGFTDLTADGSISFTQGVASTSTTTGTLIVTGGVGISGEINSGGIVKFTSNTASTGTTSGTLIVTGGMGVSGDIFAGAITSSTLEATSNTAATSTTSGALKVAGGAGIVGALYVGGNISNTGVNSVITLTPSGSGSITLSPSGTGSVTIGPAAAGTINNMSIGASTRSTGAFTTLAANSSVTFTAGTVSNSTSTGTLVVTGGVGVSGAVNIGGALSAGGQATFTQNATSSSTTSGSVVVTGGMGVSGAIYAGGIQGTPIGSTTASTGTFTALTVTGTTILQNTQEKYQVINGATGTVVHNWAAGALFYHTNPAAAFSVNFTNVPTTDGYAYNIVLVILQGTTGRIPTPSQVNSSATGVTFSWANNTAPTAVASRIQVFSFSVLRIGTTWRIIGAAQSY
jgi:hypothetical protein